MNISLYNCLSFPWPGFNFRPRQSVSRDSFLAGHTLPIHSDPALRKMARYPLMAPHNLWTSRKKVEINKKDPLEEGISI